MTRSSMSRTSTGTSRMRLLDPYRAVVRAVNEVRPPIILATLAVIISFIPMFFITGMMGPYMAPDGPERADRDADEPDRGVHDHAVAELPCPARRRPAGATARRSSWKRAGLYRVYSGVMMPVFGRRLAALGHPGRDRAAAGLCRLAGPGAGACRSRCCRSTTRTSCRW